MALSISSTSWKKIWRFVQSKFNLVTRRLEILKIIEINTPDLYNRLVPYELFMRFSGEPVDHSPLSIDFKSLGGFKPPCPWRVSWNRVNVMSYCCTVTSSTRCQDMLVIRWRHSMLVRIKNLNLWRAFVYYNTTRRNPSQNLFPHI